MPFVLPVGNVGIGEANRSLVGSSENSKVVGRLVLGHHTCAEAYTTCKSSQTCTDEILRTCITAERQ